MSAWHTAKTGNHQRLIIDDATGRNVAVSYDAADAALIAAAPALRAAAEKFAALDRDVEALPYPLKVRFRVALQACEAALSTVAP